MNILKLPRLFKTQHLTLLMGLMLGATSVTWSATNNQNKNTMDTITEQQIKGSSQQFILTSQYTPHHYLINLYIPQAPAPKAGYPVLYLLDGNATFESARAIAQAMAGGSNKFGTDPLVIVAIGYAGDALFSGQNRALDYTSTVATNDKPNKQYSYGGDTQFLKFIDNELKPQIFNRVRINRDQQTLFGHSFGGLFTLNTFFKRPDSFQRYFAASPSLWYNNYVLLQEQDLWRKQSNQIKKPIYLMTTVGTSESSSDMQRSISKNAARDFFSGFSRVNTNKLHSWHFYHPSEQHIGNLYASLPKAILLASCNSLNNCQKLFDEQ